MVGVRQFDEEAVIDRVMRRFWSDGYAATTMGDLAAAAGIQRGSLYNAYGGKDRLMIAALERYAAEQRAAILERLSDPDPHEAMRGFLDVHLARMTDPGNPPGCLMTRAAADGIEDPVIAEVVHRAFKRTEDALCETLKAARDRGSLRETDDPVRLARFFLGVSRGMAVVHWAYRDIAPVRDIAEEALNRLQDCQPRLGADP